MRGLRWARSVWGWPTDLSWTFHLHCHCLGFCFQRNVAVAVGRQVLHLTGDLGKWWCSISIRVTPASLPVAISLMLVVWPFFGESRWTWCPWPCLTWNIFGSQMSCCYRYIMIRTHVLWKSCSICVCKISTKWMYGLVYICLRRHAILSRSRRVLHPDVKWQRECLQFLKHLTVCNSLRF